MAETLFLDLCNIKLIKLLKSILKTTISWSSVTDKGGGKRLYDHTALFPSQYGQAGVGCYFQLQLPFEPHEKGAEITQPIISTASWGRRDFSHSKSVYTFPTTPEYNLWNNLKSILSLAKPHALRWDTLKCSGTSRKWLFIFTEAVTPLPGSFHAL